ASRTSSSSTCGSLFLRRSIVASRPGSFKRRSLAVVPNIRVQRVVDREADAQPFFVGKTHQRCAPSDRAKPEALWRDVLLAVHIGGTNDQTEAVQCGVVQLEVLQDHLERAAFTAMIQLHLVEPSGVEGCRALPLRSRQQLPFRYEQELGLLIDEPDDQPWAR